MMGRSHLITGVCAIEHAYVANELIKRADIVPLTMIQQAVWNYLGLGDMTLLMLPVCLTAYFLGTLLPDIDNPDSLIGRFFYIPVEHRKWLHAIYLYLAIGALRWLEPLLVIGFEKLEELHPIIAWCHPAFTVILKIISWISPVSAWIFIGSVVHLFWDSFSAMGNCWFYKLFSDYIEYPSGAKIKKGHWLKLYHAGEWSEYLLVFVIVMVTIASFVWIRRIW